MTSEESIPTPDDITKIIQTGEAGVTDTDIAKLTQTQNPATDKMIQADDTGISAYADPENWESIPCVFKLLFSDFIVEELENGEVVTLWPLEKEELQEVPGEGEKSAEKSPPADILPLPKGFCEENVTLAMSLPKGETLLIDTTPLDKEERTAIHKYIRDLNPNLNSKTEGDSIVISVASRADRKRRAWPEGQPDYLYFTLSKEFKDTSYCIRELSFKSGLNMKAFSFCGTKDRRGVTSQRVSCYRVPKEKMANIAEAIKNTRIHNFSYRQKQLDMGCNEGNRFSIILRDVPKELGMEAVAKRIEGIGKYGFLNYFGHQRFGTLGVNTAEIGRLLLNENFQEALDKIILTKLTNSTNDFKAALESYEADKDAKKAYNMLGANSKFKSIEGQLLNGLLKYNGNAKEALLQSLQRESLSLYIHAFQSYIWNHVVSERINKYGPIILPGDFDENGKVLEEGSTIFDIAIPLVSIEMDLPENETKEMIVRHMERFGVSKESFRPLLKRCMVSKTFRKMFKKATSQIKCELINYEEERQLLQRELLADAIQKEGTTFTGLKVQFSLGSGDYATMLLREFLRFNVDKESQKALGNVVGDRA
uniref:TRUD domain-containing protein n=1 Tax=Rhabditophanes sp. KR3021 TaxID=114890 RepID=A0AC35TS18_9BILA